MLQSRCFAGVVVFAMLGFAGAVAQAVPIQITINGTGSGTIGSDSFTSALFTINLTGDTDNRVDPATNVYGIPLSQATIDIAGIGEATFTFTSRAWVNRNLSLAGFSKDLFGDGSSGPDIVDVDGAAFATWDMTTNVGPVFDAELQPVSQAQNLDTSRGALSFSAYSNGVYTALVPEPTGLLLLAAGIPLALRRRRSA
jgi:hypothetical protein